VGVVWYAWHCFLSQRGQDRLGGLWEVDVVISTGAGAAVYRPLTLYASTTVGGWHKVPISEASVELLGRGRAS